MTSEANKDKLKEHEKVLKSLVIDERITLFILSILGIKESNEELLSGVIETNEKLKKSYFNLITAEALLNLPKLNLNIHSQQAQGEWIKSNNRLKISNDENYEKLLEEAINTIYPPKNVRADGLIPLTIFLPGSVEMEGDNLIGKKSCWNFITIKSESTTQATGSLELINNPDSLFGLRFFSIFQSLGLVDPLQSPKKNTLFSNIIQSTGLGNHFNLVNSKNIKRLKKLQDTLVRFNKKITDNNDDINDLQDKINSWLNNLRKSDEEIEKQVRIKHKKIAELEEENNVKFEEIKSTEEEFEQLNSTLITNDITQSFYYCTKKHISSHEELDGGVANFTLPAFKFAESPIFQSNIIETEDKIPAKRFMERMQFMLSYLLSMTSGTAITFLLKPEKTTLKGHKWQGLEAPTIILPKVWNELALGLKQHNPKNSVENYFESTDNKNADKTTYQQALYFDFWHKKDELLRCIPTGKGLSLMKSTFATPTPKKKSPKKTT